ncbi:MAG: hypothetical protein WC623_11735 [Pedobacter sp.]|uniref:hypothetical protein n=1 Tax=Pedobacter sp. TaxID=1411316 RepID=UPI003562DCDC
MKRKADFIFIAILGLLLANALVQFIMGHILLTLNDYLGILLWLITCMLRFTNHRYGRYALGILLALGIFDIASFGLGGISFSVGFGSMKPIGFNPIVLLITVIYFLVNKTVIRQVLEMIVYPSAEEQQLKDKKQRDFYLRKFENCDDDELGIIFGNLEEYPVAAQHAIIEICKAKGITMK